MSPQVPTVWEQLISYWYFKKGTKVRVHEWVCPSILEIAKDTGLSTNTVKKCIRELMILGFIIKIETRYKGSSQLNDTNKYYLNDNPGEVLMKLPELEKFRNVKRSKNLIEEDGWGVQK
jgi:DNA-binding transcriptional MocR family regulator